MSFRNTLAKKKLSRKIQETDTPTPSQNTKQNVKETKAVAKKELVKTTNTPKRNFNINVI